MKYSNQSDDFYERPAIGRFFFFPKDALTHHLQSRRWYPSRWSGSCALHELSFRQFSRGGQAMPQADIPCAVGSIFCAISKTMGRHIATPSRRLPAKTCHRQLLRSYGYLLSGDTHFLISKEKQKERTVKTNGNLSSGSKSS